MIDDRELDELLDAFFAEGTNEVADRVIDAGLAEIDRTQQRRAMGPPWRFPTMTMPIRLVVSAVVLMLVAGGVALIARPGQPAVAGPSPSPSATASFAPVGSASLPPSPAASQPRVAAWTPVGDMTVARYLHTATLLADGRVLVAGGRAATDIGPSLATAELYDPRTRAWTATGNMTSPRSAHTATLLPNGKVLVAGGYDDFHALTSAELYDPVTGSWTVTGAMVEGQGYDTATLLQSGKVLVAGGRSNNSSTGSPLASAELYDPVAGTWTATGGLLKGRPYDTATLLRNGTVLVAGTASRSFLADTLATAEIYEPSDGSWSLTKPIAQARDYHTATLLLDGTVLVAGGYDGTGKPSSLTDRYDDAAGTWTTTASMNVARAYHTATLLPDGRVLVTGGDGVASSTGSGSSTYTRGQGLASSEVFDPADMSWRLIASMTHGRELQTATLLSDGTVLIAGGLSAGQGLVSAELYEPGSGS